jgi:hypothetical protein
VHILHPFSVSLLSHLLLTTQPKLSNFHSALFHAFLCLHQNLSTHSTLVYIAQLINKSYLFPLPVSFIPIPLKQVEMAFVLHAERNAAGSIFYLPAGFDNYLNNIHTTSNVPDLFAEDFFEDLPVRVHVPNQPAPPAVPQVAPGTPPQAPPPANSMGATGMGISSHGSRFIGTYLHIIGSNNDDDDDQSFSGDDDDAPCGNYDGYVRDDGCTVTDTATDTATGE